MRLLVGLGNPGEGYKDTRHNAGFVAVDAVAHVLESEQWKNFKDGLLVSGGTGERKWLLFKPQQYMNNSGIQVRQVVDYYNLNLSDVAVVSDDVYIEPGAARIRESGGDGGHNGLKSLNTHLGADTFWRIRLGVGVYPQKTEEHHQAHLDEYVLAKLPPHDAKKLHQLIDTLTPNLVEWLEHRTEFTVHTTHI